MAYTVTVRHVDTCLSSFVLDHHNRPGECLLGVIVDRSSRVHGVKTDLIREARDYGDFPEDMTDAEINAAIVEAFEGAHPFKAWDKSLDPRSEDDRAEFCQSWFLFQWEAVETFLPDDDGEDASTLAVDGDSSPAAPVVALDDETAPTGRSAEIRAKLAPALLDAYRYHRQQRQIRILTRHREEKTGFAVMALEFSRRDIASNTPRYPVSEHRDFSAWGLRNKTVRYIEDPRALGLRFVNPAHEIISLNHTGWYTAENGENGETVTGVVYQLPGRDGRPVFVAGHDDPNNAGAATIDFGTLYWGNDGEDCDSAKRDAARAGDEMARRYGEEESEHGRHWQAGARFVDLGAEHSDLRKLTLAALRELHGTSPDSRRAFVTSRYQLLKSYLTTREVVREEQAKLEAAHGGAPGFMEHFPG